MQNVKKISRILRKRDSLFNGYILEENSASQAHWIQNLEFANDAQLSRRRSAFKITVYREISYATLCLRKVTVMCIALYLSSTLRAIYVTSDVFSQVENSIRCKQAVIFRYALATTEVYREKPAHVYHQ